MTHAAAAAFRELPKRVFPPVTQAYGERDTILYALGLGLAPLAAADAALLPYVHERGLSSIPTQAAVLASPGFWMMEPGTGIDWPRVVAAGYAIELHAPLPPSGTVTSTTRVIDVFDRGADKGAVIQWERDLVDATGGGRLLAEIRSTAFARGNGGFGGAAWPASVPRPAPSRAPDRRFEWQTTPGQTLVYRLSGDMNPLHADPAVARAAGYERPILHGLCTLGIACFQLHASCCGPAGLRSIEARFTSVVYPGDLLCTDVWRVPGGMVFRMSVPARGVVVLDAGTATAFPPAASAAAPNTNHRAAGVHGAPARSSS